MLVLYGLLPYLFISIQLARHGRPKDMDVFSTDYIFYGWATEGYKPHAYIWEPLNALIILLTVMAAELLDESQQIVQATIAGASIVLHVLVRPYEDRAGNVVVVLFNFCELFGIIGADEHVILQWFHLVLLLAAVMILIFFTIIAGIDAVRNKREEIRAGKQKHVVYTVSRTEGRLLTPFMLVVLLCLSPMFLIAFVLRSAVKLFAYVDNGTAARCKKKFANSSGPGYACYLCGGTCFLCCAKLHSKIISRLAKLFLWPISIILSIVKQSVLLGVAASVGFESYLRNREKMAWVHLAEMNDIIRLGLNVKDKHPELRGVPMNVYADIDSDRLKQIDYTRFQYILPLLARSGDDIRFVFTHAPTEQNECTIHVLDKKKYSITGKDASLQYTIIPSTINKYEDGATVNTRVLVQYTVLDFDVPEIMIANTVASSIHDLQQSKAWCQGVIKYNSTVKSINEDREKWCKETIEEVGKEEWDTMSWKERWKFSLGEWRQHQAITFKLLNQNFAVGAKLTVTDPWGREYNYKMEKAKKEGDFMRFRFALDGRVGVDGKLQKKGTEPVTAAELNDIKQFGVNVTLLHPELRGKALQVYDNVDGRKLRQIGYTKFQYTLPACAHTGDDIKFIFTDVPKRINQLTMHVLEDGIDEQSAEMLKLLRSEKALGKDLAYYEKIYNSSKKNGLNSNTAIKKLNEIRKKLHSVQQSIRVRSKQKLSITFPTGQTASLDNVRKTAEGNSVVDFEVPEVMISKKTKGRASQIKAWERSNVIAGGTFQATLEKGPIGIRLNMNPDVSKCCITYVEINSQAQSRQIQVEDQIVSVGTVQVSNGKEALSALASEPRPVVLTLLRPKNAAWYNETVKEAGEASWNKMSKLMLKKRWLISTGEWRSHKLLVIQLEEQFDDSSDSDSDSDSKKKKKKKTKRKTSEGITPTATTVEDKWVKGYDSKSQKEYYNNTLTGKSRWTRPSDRKAKITAMVIQDP